MPTKQDLQQMGRTVYVGLIDDVVDRFPWGYSVDHPYFERLLRRAALFEPPWLLNDGYLLHYDWGRAELASHDSLLRKLMSLGMVVLFTRQPDGSISDMPEQAASTVESYKRLVSAPEWIDTKERLRRFERSDRYRWAPWPSFDNRIGFEKLIVSIRDRPLDMLGLNNKVTELQFDRIIANFLFRREREPYRGARTVWEETVVDMTPGSRVARQALMHLGNEAYHYNLGLCVSAACKSQVGVATRLSPIFAPTLIESSDTMPDDQLALEVSDFLLKIDRHSFARIVGDQHVQEKKREFLDALWEYRSGVLNKEGMQDALAQYDAEIKRAAISEMRQYSTEILGASFALGTANLVLPLLWPKVWGVLVAGLGVLGNFASGPALHALSLWRCRKSAPLLEDRVRASAPTSVDATITSLQATTTSWLDANQGSAHVANLPKIG